MNHPRAWANVFLAPLVLLCPVVVGGCGGGEEQAPGIAESAPPQVEPEVEALLRRLEVLRQAGQTELALELARAQLAREPKTPRLHYAIGALLGASEDHHGALAAFERELAVDPGHFYSHFGTAAAAMRLGLHEQALAALEVCAAMRPSDQDVTFQRGRTLSNLGRFEEAEPLLTAVARERGDADAWTEVGLLERRRRRPEAAAEAFRQALAVAPDHPPALANLGQILIQQGQRELGEQILERHRDRAQLADRLDHFERSSRLTGATAANHTALADTRLRAGDRTGALAAYRRAVELDPNHPIAAMGLAALLLEDGVLEEATRWSVVALMNAPQDHRAHYLLGLVRAAKGQVAEAQRAFAESRKLGAWGPDAVVRVADAYARAGESEQASALLQELAEQKPTEAPVLVGMARVALRLGEPRSAASWARTAASSEPRLAEAWLMLGLASALQGNTNDADSAWRAAIELQAAELVAPNAASRIAARFGSLPGAERAFERYLELAQPVSQR